MRNRQPLLVVAILVALVVSACVATDALRPWTLVDLPLPGTQPRWLATWPGVRGVMLVSTTDDSTVSNSITVQRVINGHERMTGLAVWHDTTLGSGDLLVYVNSFDNHRVWRYQVDPTDWSVRGQLQMLSPQHPLGLTLSAGGDSICVTGDTTDATRVVQCYRISRALADDGVTINEWWVLMSNFQWTGAAADPEHPRAESLMYDTQALPTEASRAGSVWVDPKQPAGWLVRFPVDSITGAFMPSSLTLPDGLDAVRLSWTITEVGNQHLLVAANSAYRVSWSRDTGAPVVSAAEPLHATVSPHDHLRAVVWRNAALGQFDRLDLALGGNVVTLSYNRLDDAIAVGEVAPSPSQTPSTTPPPSQTPTQTPLSTATHSPMPSATATRTAQATASPTPTPFAKLPVNSEDKVASGDKSDSSSSLHALWALTVLALPCCALPCAVYLVVRKRHSIATTGGVAWLRRGKPAQPYTMGLTTGGGGGDESTGTWTTDYDIGTPAAVAIPTGIQNSPFLVRK